MTICALAETHAVQTTRAVPICIIGGGIAGLLVAVRLARSGRRVLVVESGLDRFDEQIHELNDIEDRFGHYNRALTGRFRGFGGTSCSWGGRLIPLSAHDTGARPHLSLSGWPFPVSELASYTQELEKLFGVDAFSYEEELLKHFDRGGMFPRWDSELRCRWFKCPTHHRANIGATFRREVAHLRNLEVWLGATVCGFELDRDSGRLARVTARDFGDHRLTVTADEFVLAAGSIETTRLLLLLDASSDERAFAGCNALGRYFQEHARAVVGKVRPLDPVKTNRLFGYRFVGRTRRNLHLELTPAIQQAEGVASAYAEVALDLLPQSPLGIARDLRRDLQKRQYARLGPSTRRLTAHAGYLTRAAYWRLVHSQLLMPPDTGLKLEICIEQLPDWNNRIVLSRQRDRLDVPKVSLEWQLRDADERTFRSAAKHVAAYWARSGFDGICPVEWADYVQTGGTKFIDVADQRAHPSGSTRMGVNPTTSVVDADLRCHHVRNVWVTSASTFPTSGSSNPTLTIMQLALRAADALLRHTSGSAMIHGGALQVSGAA
jgi:Choline dehydrogenase and related flavoproteins